jgi:hypothetical protein
MLYVPWNPMTLGRVERESMGFLKEGNNIWAVVGLLVCFGFPSTCDAQNAPESQGPDQQNGGGQAAVEQSGPLSTPSVTGPLQMAPPMHFEVSPVGVLNINGIVSGMGLASGNHIAADDSTQAALSNGQIFLQKTEGWWQFYVEAGAYNILSLGTPFLKTETAVSDLYGPVPVAYLKLAPAKNTSILVGALPTLMGAESTFDFQNMNIERGLLWNQENAINRGIQISQTIGKVTASISWNDGYYSNRYSWLSGSLAYTTGPHTLTFVGMGNLSETPYQTLATPVQNNSHIYALMYTYSKGSWIVQPYYQYSKAPTNSEVGVAHENSTHGGAILVTHKFQKGLSLSGRGEYITSTGSDTLGSVNLMYGPGSAAWSFTVTPTFQHGRFFTRGDVSIVRATNFAPGSAFGSSGMDGNQTRGVIEVGFLF